jgi:thiamine pyrophosphokinase
LSANRLYQATKRLENKNTNCIPDLMRGDLDSLLLDVRQHYQGLGVRIEEDPCQNTNDLDKALQVCYRAYSRMLVFGAFGGRF